MHLLLSAIMLQIAYIACQLADKDDDYTGPATTLSKITTTLQYSADCVIVSAETVAWVALVLLDNGIGLVKPVEVTRKRIRTTRAVYWIAALCVVLQLISWAIYLAQLWPPNSDGGILIAPFFIDAACKGILAIGILAILIRAIVVRVRFRKAQHVQRVSIGISKSN